LQEKIAEKLAQAELKEKNNTVIVATTYKLSPVQMVCVTATAEKFPAVVVAAACGSVQHV
jgi:hypothetical protein